MRLSAAIKEISAVDESSLLEIFGETWFQIKATRNAIAHNYSFVDEPLLSETVVKDLPLFEPRLRSVGR